MHRVHLHEGEERSPLSCSDLYAEYERYWNQSPDDPNFLRKRPNLKDEFTKVLEL